MTAASPWEPEAGSTAAERAAANPVYLALLRTLREQARVNPGIPIAITITALG